ncbi:hypothetical protein NQ318_002584 [Aromia moschata]|uniref:Uncharacterized protein n=1 Tax=Aromia moschata TaxID=1265417 RepID=A0AAV8Y840_9CUCU|nr:hypothetical protein NQ318_002584 [Aromia moschata]
MYEYVDACSSRTTPKPRPPAPTPRPNITFHTYECPPAYAAWYCLNGATCFTVKIGDSLLYNCDSGAILNAIGKKSIFKPRILKVQTLIPPVSEVPGPLQTGKGTS